MASTYSLTLRSDLNRKLTIEEMDNNFLYLDNKSGGSPSATLPIVTNLGTGTASYNQGNNFLGLGLTYSGQIFDTGSGGYNVIVSVDGTAADDAKDLSVFGYFEPNGDSANVSTRYDSEKSIVNISASSLTFSAEIVVGASTTYSTSSVKFRFSGVTNSFYYFPSSNPQPGQVLGYDGANQLGWVTNVGDYLPLSGGTMDGAIYFGTGGQNISHGSFDNGLGGNKGIALNCAINYELNWQAGHLSNYYNSGYVPIIFDSNIRVGDGTSIQPYEINMGNLNTPNFIAGVDGGAYLKLSTGDEGVGKVWTSDVSGWGSWKSSMVLLGKVIGYNANNKDDQNISLNGGGNYMITQVIITNYSEYSSTQSLNANKMNIYTGTNNLGHSLFREIDLTKLDTPESAIISTVDHTYMISSSIVYGTLNSASFLTPSSFDIYLYGYTF